MLIETTALADEVPVAFAYWSIPWSTLAKAKALVAGMKARLVPVPPALAMAATPMMPLLPMCATAVPVLVPVANAF